MDLDRELKAIGSPVSLVHVRADDYSRVQETMCQVRSSRWRGGVPGHNGVIKAPREICSCGWRRSCHEAFGREEESIPSSRLRPEMARLPLKRFGLHCMVVEAAADDNGGAHCHRYRDGRLTAA